MDCLFGFHGEDKTRTGFLSGDVRMTAMSVEEVEAQALQLDPKDRARLAEKLLASLETLSGEENDRLWAEEAERRDADWESAPDTGRPAADVLKDARAKLK